MSEKKTQWTGKACQYCGGGKGPKYSDRKYCGNCQYKKKRERSGRAHARALETRYGISGGDYWRLYAFQGGVCYICRRATGKTRRLTVDHDHATGMVRGLLCRPCNTLLGHLRDDPEAFQRVIDYLTNTPWQAMLESERTKPGGQNGSTT